MDSSNIIASIIALIGSVASGGWGGLAAMAFALVAGAVGITFLIKKVNGWRDDKDMAGHGGAVGPGAVDLRNQDQRNEDLLDALEKEKAGK